MRLVTYERAGLRRLGAYVGSTVVDLPDAVGHPVFPTTMEALLDRRRGTTLDAAREALSRPDSVHEAAVPSARVLAPLQLGELALLDPDADVDIGPVARLEVGVATALGRPRPLSADGEAGPVVGFALAATWRGAETKVSLGPWIVTVHDAPREGSLAVRLDGIPVWEGTWTAPRDDHANPGHAGRLLLAPPLTSVAAGDGLEAGTVVIIEADGLGAIRHRLVRGARRRRPTATAG